MNLVIDRTAPARRAAPVVWTAPVKHPWLSRLAVAWAEAMEAYALLARYRNWPGGF